MNPVRNSNSGKNKNMRKEPYISNGMNRRNFLKSMGLGAAMAAFPGSLSGSEQISGRGSAEKPNFIIIMADDLGYGDVGCYGNRTIKTPNIDALAKGGMRFTDYHSNGAVCSPTRAALLTGRYQQRCGVEGVVSTKAHRDKGMAMKEVTFAEVLKSAGYVTALMGKWHLGYRVEFNPTNQGFDEFRGYVSGNVDYHSHLDNQLYEDWWKDKKPAPEKGYTTDLITKHGVRFIEQHRDEPFCLYLPHEAVHSPYQGRKDAPQRIKKGEARPDETEARDVSAAYKEMLEVMDEGIGRIVGTVRRLGLERKTFMLFCSDNGANQRGSNAPLAGYKGSLWEGGHRVPAVAYWPGKIRASTVTDETVLGMDLFPTMVSIAGARLSGGLKLDGVDLSPMLLDGKGLPKRSLFWRHGNAKAMRKGQWKLLVMGNKTSLYNLAEDLGEQKDLASARPEMVRKLQAELSAWEREVSAGVEQLS